MRGRLEGRNGTDVHDEGPMDADEQPRIEPALQFAHSFAEQVCRTPSPKARIVACGLDPLDVAHLDEPDAPANPDRQPLRAFRDPPPPGRGAPVFPLRVRVRRAAPVPGSVRARSADGRRASADSRSPPPRTRGARRYRTPSRTPLPAHAMVLRPRAPRTRPARASAHRETPGPAGRSPSARRPLHRRRIRR